jgi:hypothetical protein
MGLKMVVARKPLPTLGTGVRLGLVVGFHMTPDHSSKV